MNYLFLLALLFCVSAIHAACTADWQCGNPVYFDCLALPECTLLSGVATAPGGLVYWAERCQQGNSSTVYVVRRKATGEISRVIVVPESVGGYEYRVTSLVGANSQAVYVSKDAPVYGLVTGFAVEGEGFSEEFNTYSPRSSLDFKFAFDEQNQRSFGCWHPFYGVVIGFPTLNVSYSSTASSIFIQTTCAVLAYYENEVFWTAGTFINQEYGTRFFRGSATCDSCVGPASFADISGSVLDFEIYNGKIYYSQPNEGIKSVELATLNFNNPNVIISNANVNKFAIGNNKIYYHDGTSIKAINLDGSSPENIYTPALLAPKCVCHGGFSGVNCNECPGGSIQWENDEVTCVRIDGSGWPVSCSADYHCGHPPYARCNARKCECATGFLGIPPSCSECVNGFISWVDDVPSCVSNN